MVGNGRPVVFLHGFLESITMWEHLSLSENIQQILIDLPGHGASELQSEELSMASVAKDVKIILDDLNLQEYQIVGHSMGGYVGLELKKIDVRCQKLVLLNSNFWEDTQQKKEDRMRVAKIVQKNKKLFIYEAIPNLFINPMEHNNKITALLGEASLIDAQTIASFSITMSKRQNNLDFVVQNAKDILIIQGKEDAIVSCTKMRELTDSTGIEVIEIDDCGHMGHIEKSEEVNNILKKYLAKG